MARTKCMWDGKPLPPGALQDLGFCNIDERKLWEEEREYDRQKALEAFKKEGEPNRGKR